PGRVDRAEVLRHLRLRAAHPAGGLGDTELDSLRPADPGALVHQPVERAHPHRLGRVQHRQHLARREHAGGGGHAAAPTCASHQAMNALANSLSNAPARSMPATRSPHSAACVYSGSKVSCPTTSTWTISVAELSEGSAPGETVVSSP